jgi:hypothetical protein
MAETLATVTQDGGFTAVVTQTGLTLSSTNLANPAVLETVSDIGDVDTVNKVDGSILVYKTTTNKWTSTTTLDAQNMEGGEF